MYQNVNFLIHIKVETELDLAIALFGLIILRTNSSSKHRSISCALSSFFVIFYIIILKKKSLFVLSLLQNSSYGFCFQ